MTRTKFALALAALGLLVALGYFVSRPEVLRFDKSDLQRRDGVWQVKSSGETVTGILVEYDPQNAEQLISEIPLKEGLAHGVARGWHPNGQLEVEEPFVNGKSHGTRTRYHANGQVRSVATIVEGVLQGSFKEYHDTGQLAVEMTLVDGVGQGSSRAWFPSGQLKAKVVLKDGEPEEAEYFEDATLPAVKPNES